MSKEKPGEFMGLSPRAQYFSGLASFLFVGMDAGRGIQDVVESELCAEKSQPKAIETLRSDSTLVCTPLNETASLGAGASIVTLAVVGGVALTAGFKRLRQPPSNFKPRT